MEEEVPKKAKPQRKRKQSTSPPVDVGCFDLLKKLSCSVQCGSKTVSVKESVSSGSSEMSVPEKKKITRRRKKSTETPKVKRKRGNQTDIKTDSQWKHHQSMVWIELVNMTALDWNTVTMDLQRSVNNLALYVLESMSAPTWLPTFVSTLDLTKPPPGYEDLTKPPPVYEASTEVSEMSDEKPPSRQKKPPKKKPKMNNAS